MSIIGGPLSEVPLYIHVCTYACVVVYGTYMSVCVQLLPAARGQPDGWQNDLPTCVCVCVCVCVCSLWLQDLLRSSALTREMHRVVVDFELRQAHTTL